MLGTVPKIWFLLKSKSCSEYFGHPTDKLWIIIERSSLNLLPDRSSDLNEHRLPNEFGIPPSKELEPNLRLEFRWKKFVTIRNLPT